MFRLLGIFSCYFIPNLLIYVKFSKTLFGLFCKFSEYWCCRQYVLKGYEYYSRLPSVFIHLHDYKLVIDFSPSQTKIGILEKEEKKSATMISYSPATMKTATVFSLANELKGNVSIYGVVIRC